MLSERQLRQIRAENELLLLEIEDVNAIIKQRETELDGLRLKAQKAIQLQSKLQMNLYEFEQMQNSIGEAQKQAMGTAVRMEEMENELLAAIKMENKYYNMLDENVSLQANLKDTMNELDEAATLYKKVRQLKTELGRTMSELELAQLEIQSLKEDLKEERALQK